MDISPEAQTAFLTFAAKVLEDYQAKVNEIVSQLFEWGGPHSISATSHDRCQELAVCGITVGAFYPVKGSDRLPQESVIIHDTHSGTYVEFGNTPPPPRVVIALLDALLEERASRA